MCACAGVCVCTLVMVSRREPVVSERWIELLSGDTSSGRTSCRIWGGRRMRRKKRGEGGKGERRGGEGGVYIRGGGRGKEIEFGGREWKKVEE